MQTSVELDRELVSAAMRAFGTSVEQDAVREAVAAAVLLRQQEALMALWGMGWEGDLDEMRTNKRLDGGG